ncbi:MAG: phage integrase Arm DNA-binding domain-containing protein [Symbiopectobacterium sp.]
MQPRNDGYFCYRDPRKGKEYGLGRNHREAITVERPLHKP